MKRRDFLQAATVMAGAGLVWRYGGSVALGQLPFKENADMPPLTEAEGLELGQRRVLGDGIKNEYPVLAFDGGGILWAAWVSEREDGEQIYAVRFANGKWTAEEKVSASDGFAAHPAIASRGEEVAIVWTERKTFDRWDLLCRRYVNGVAQPVVALAEDDGINWRPRAAYDPQGRLWVVSERKKTGGKFEAVARRIEKDGSLFSRVLSANAEADCCRPSIAVDGNGVVWAAWDQQDVPGFPNVWLVEGENPNVDYSQQPQPIQVTSHPAANLAPSIACDAQGRVWIAWMSNRRGENEWDIPRWYYLRCYAEGKFHDPVSEPPGKILDKSGTDQSFEFPQVLCAPDGKVVVTGRPSHNFCVQIYHGEEWSPLYRLPEDGWGGRGQFLEAAFDAQGDLWMVRRDLQGNVLQRLTGLAKDEREPALQPAKESTGQAVSNVQRRPTPAWKPLEKLEGITEPLHFYYGDLHGHTWMSDGMGDVDEYYHIRRHCYEDDFASLTDHDTFVGNSILPSEFELMKVLTEHFNEAGRFVTLFGQEYTTARYPTRIGHKCVYSTNRDIPLFDHTDEAASTGRKLADLVRKWDALMIPHHTGWTGTDWENASDDIQPLVEMISNHGRMEFMGNRPIPHRGGLRGHFVQDGLKRGLKFGLIGGSDAHGLIWHHGMAYKRETYRTGLACFLMPELTPEALMAAMRKRRAFATTGIKPRVDFRVNGHLMGEEITISDSKVQITVDVLAQHDLRWLSIVKDNETWYEYGGEGYQSRFTVVDEDVAPGSHWYYLRLEFEGDEMVWTSPVFVERATA